MCYQTSQRNWVTIKELYRCLQRYMLSWRISRLGFVTPIVGEVSLGPLGNTHHLSLASIITNELVKYRHTSDSKFVYVFTHVSCFRLIQF